ncbi:MAG: pyridoxamine 5'-phosphate oxidase family protein [Blautia sp.]|jgi:nitroimidazol reductase NimA-like FMN-containing flavoprotein (pyridoxamine 5'-phosphate oxidase superfamily)
MDIYRKMRLSKREVRDKKELRNIIENCDVLRIGVCDEEGIFIVPVNFGYEWKEDSMGNVDLRLYLHSAGEGRKADAFAVNPMVAIEMDCDHELITGDYACSYSFGFSSIMGSGRIYQVTDPEKKKHGISLVMAHTAPGTALDFKEEMIRRTNVYCIHVEHFTGKERKKKKQPS